MSVLAYAPDFARLERELPALREAFDDAQPIRHVVIDDFLPVPVARALYDAFPPLAPVQRSVARLLEARSYDGDVARHGAEFDALFAAFGAERFTAWLRALTGIDDARMDPQNVGGGLHQGARGSRLHVHADHNTHPSDPARYRRLNVLTYLNPDWQPAWGGDLELWDAGCSRVVARIAPRFNRCVIMDVHDHAFHGYGRLRVPAHETRKTMAAYFYSASPAPEQARAAHPTLFGRAANDSTATRLAVKVRRSILHRLLPRFDGLKPPTRRR